MQQTRIYFLQFLGIFLLICGYFLRDQPDHLSVMHFNPNPSSPTVISKSTKSHHPRKNSVHCSASSPSGATQRSENPKYIAFEIAPINQIRLNNYSFDLLKHACKKKGYYNYLFFKEINPPPPKAC